MKLVLAALVATAASAALSPLAAQVVDNPYTIMKPEPWLAPKYKSPRRTKERVVTPSPPVVEPRRIPDVPPPVMVPQTGRALPNLPQPAPASGMGGRETYQDRTTRCTHQAGVYGTAAGDRSNYITTCINQ